uniref:DUF148 domain-containing protein n=1 Tax=Strongyloides venezuelensis TaxID=75913 RepID=A0A0K0G0Q7_STRVS
MIVKRCFVSYFIIFIITTRYNYGETANTLETLPLTADEMKILTSIRDELTNSGKTNFDEFYQVLSEKNSELAGKIFSAREAWNNKFDNLQTEAKAWMEEVREAKPSNGKTPTSEEMAEIMDKIRSSFNNLSEVAKKELEDNFPAVVKQMGIENKIRLNLPTIKPAEE